MCVFPKEKESATGEPGSTNGGVLYYFSWKENKGVELAHWGAQCMVFLLALFKHKIIEPIMDTHMHVKICWYLPTHFLRMLSFFVKKMCTYYHVINIPIQNNSYTSYTVRFHLDFAMSNIEQNTWLGIWPSPTSICIHQSCICVCLYFFTPPWSSPYSASLLEGGYIFIPWLAQQV